MLFSVFQGCLQAFKRNICIGCLICTDCLDEILSLKSKFKFKVTESHLQNLSHCWLFVWKERRNYKSNCKLLACYLAKLNQINVFLCELF